MRIDMKKLIAIIKFSDFCEMTNTYNIDININSEDYENYIKKFNFTEQLSLL